MTDFKTWRLGLFKTQAQAAEAFGVDQSTVSRWEDGAALPLWAVKMQGYIEQSKTPRST